MRNDEARTHAPWIRAEALAPPYSGEVFAVHNYEIDSEFLRHFVLPLAGHCGRSGNDNIVHAPPKQHFTKYEPCFNRLTKTDIVCDQKIHTSKLERFRQR